MVIEVSSPVDGVLYLRRAFLPLWRVAIDGEGRLDGRRPSRLTSASRCRPAGTRCGFWTDRRPLAAGLGLALRSVLLGVGWLLAGRLGRRGRRGRRGLRRRRSRRRPATRQVVGRVSPFATLKRAQATRAFDRP